jgi:hypothetical protein
MDVMIHYICHYEIWERLLMYGDFGVEMFAQAVVSNVWLLSMQMRVDLWFNLD